MQISTIKTLEEFLDEAMRLRRESEESEARFLLFLSEFEKQRPDLWQTAGCQNYESFLQSSHLVNPARYRNRHPYEAFKRGAALVSDPVRIGAGATIAASEFRVPSADNLKQFEERAAVFKEEHGVAPSEQHAKVWVKQLDPPPARPLRQVSRLSELEAENERLKSENKELRRQLKTAEKKLARFEKTAA